MNTDEEISFPNIVTSTKIIFFWYGDYCCVWYMLGIRWFTVLSKIASYKLNFVPWYTEVDPFDYTALYGFRCPLALQATSIYDFFFFSKNFTTVCRIIYICCEYFLLSNEWIMTPLGNGWVVFYLALNFWCWFSYR